MSQFLKMFQNVGAEQFSKLVGTVAPYFSTIDPEFVELKPGYAEMILRNQKKVHNHIGTIHAIAMCNAAELVAGTMTDVSIPSGARWIPQAMSVQYLNKAKTDLKVVAEGEGIDFSQGGAVVVPVSAYDDAGEKCFTADITMNVKLGA